MAEGLLHDFEGFFMFLLCIALLVLEMSLLARWGGRGASLRSVFGLEYPAPVAAGTPVAERVIPRPAVAGALMLAAMAAALAFMPAREQIKPERAGFESFPLTLDGGWQGQPDRIEPDVLAALAVTDHLIANFSRPQSPWINFYAAYYDQQSSGESTHSPRTCIPGGGWAIATIADAEVPTATTPLRVNRALIQKGEQRQLVYYWFSQRGRVLTSELAVKWYIFHDAITRQRSDGALIRVVTPVLPSEQEAQADERLANFLKVAEPRLSAYVPH